VRSNYSWRRSPRTLESDRGESRDDGAETSSARPLRWLRVAAARGEAQLQFSIAGHLLNPLVSEAEYDPQQTGRNRSRICHSSSSHVAFHLHAASRCQIARGAAVGNRPKMQPSEIIRKGCSLRTVDMQREVQVLLHRRIPRWIIRESAKAIGHPLLASYTRS